MAGRRGLGQVVGGILKDRGVATGKVGVEERVRFFIADGLRARGARVQFVLATPITAGCRMIKSPAEIALMQRANDITHRRLSRRRSRRSREGMTQVELARNIAAAYRARSARRAAARRVIVRQVHRVSARQHRAAAAEGGRRRPRSTAAARWSGYQSDITRTTVFGKPTQRQERSLEPREAGAGGGVRGGEGRRDVRVGGRRGAQGDHRRRLRPRLQGAGPSAPHRPRHRHGRARVDELRAREHDEARSPACASATSR